MTAPGPYTRAARGYWELGWRNPIPVRGKHPPITGYTGRDGADVTDADITRWCAGREGGWNIGLRLHDGVIGIDVDAYDGKQGAATIAKAEIELGGLPPTWSTTSRGPGQPARILLYRVPEGLGWRSAEANIIDRFGGDVNVIHRGWRYAMVAGSTHPETMKGYAWYDPAAAVSGMAPRPDQLAELPEAWVEALTAPGRTPYEQTRQEREIFKHEGTVPAGERRVATLTYAGRLRAHGLTLDEAEVLLRHRFQQYGPVTGDHTWERAREILGDYFNRYPTRDGWEPPDEEWQPPDDTWAPDEEEPSGQRPVEGRGRVLPFQTPRRQRHA